MSVSAESARLPRCWQSRSSDLGIVPEIAANLGVDTHARDGGDDWISIPYVLGGRVVNHKYRTLAGEKRFHQDSGATKCFWNADVITDSTLAHLPLIITEGEFDAFVAIQCDYLRVVSVPDGLGRAGAPGGACTYRDAQDGATATCTLL